MKLFAILSGALMLAAPGVSLAQVTQTYSYDGNGRLTGVVTTGGTGTHTSAYAYDKANNRTSRSQTGVTTWAAIDRLPFDELLEPDQALTSPDGRYSLALRPSGQLELWLGDEPAEGDVQAATAAFALTADGQAQFLQTASVSDRAWLSLRDNGELILIDEAGAELWQSANLTSQEAGQ